jgi:hypothetical protein
MEDSLFERLRDSFDLKPGQLIVLRGNGNQQLAGVTAENELVSEGVGRIRDRLSRLPVGRRAGEVLDKVLDEQKKASSAIEAKDKVFVRDGKRNIISLKSGGVTIYVVPPDMEVEPVDSSSVKRY